MDTSAKETKTLPEFSSWEEFYAKNPQINWREIGVALEGETLEEFKVKGESFYLRKKFINP